METIIEKIKEYLVPLLNDEGVDLKSIRYFQDPQKNNILEVGVLRKTGVTDLQVIEVISPHISNWLDAIDLIDESYFLDVYAAYETRATEKE